ncbi:MAG: PhoH family protein [Clostridiales bacterium]|jgi:phosphate starvation-inducible PhoH-like protein|nr:PhoH family protein [Clostridiales bacterium]
MPGLFGAYDENIKLIDELLGVKVAANPDGITLRGKKSAVEKAGELIRRLIDLLRAGYGVDGAKVRQSLDLIDGDAPDEIMNLSKDTVALTPRGKQIKCRTVGQRAYVEAIKRNTVVFGVGPAGTGKTYLATALAAQSFKKGEYERIIIARPAVEAGEKLGFLPGDLQEKVDPYLRPLYDALGEMFGVDGYQRLIERGVIEVAALGLLRGRTLANAFIILDEAQNTTGEQMKMFLTRLGEGGKMVINGDVTQVDLPDGKRSGLAAAVRILKDVDGIGICYLTEKDIVRHELVRKIVLAYAKEQGNGA